MPPTQVINDESPTSAYSKFITKFVGLYNRSFPVRSKRVSRAKGIPRKPWITKAILKSIGRKDKLFRKYKSSPTASNKLALSVYRNKLTSLIRASKKTYFCNLLDMHKSDLKKTWGVLNDLLGDKRKKKLPDSFVINGSNVSDPQQIADGFNDFFSNIGPNLASKIPSTPTTFNDFLTSAPSPMHSLFLSPTDDAEIIDICSSLKSGTSSGFDDI